MNEIVRLAQEAGPRQKKKQPIWKRILLILGALLLAAVMVPLLWLLQYYPANQTAKDAMTSDAAVQVQEEGDRIVFQPTGEIKAGFVLYPGAKVDSKAYSPLLRELAEEGILSVAVKMPLHMAFFHIDAAEDIPGDYPEVSRWYLGGHSLGGSMAAAWLEEHGTGWDGIVFLASYSTADLTDNGLAVCSLYGSEDQVLNRERYEEKRSMLPAGMEEHIIAGGNHAGFAGYGPQPGDGEAAISQQEQTEQAAEILTEFILGETAA